MKINCPNCSHRFSLMDVADDECARTLFALSASMSGTLWRDLVPYLALFKPRTQALRWSRMLALTEDIMPLHEFGEKVLSAALRETVSAFSERRAQPDWKPLNSHNYLRAVITTIRQRTSPSDVGSTSTEITSTTKPTTKTGQALDSLQEFGNG